MEGMKIGALAREAGTNVPTVRYYESIGLLPRAKRQAGKQRTFDPADVKRLRLIRQCRAFGFPIEQVRTLVDLAEDSSRSCAEVRDIAGIQLAVIRSRLAELLELERTIAEFAESCQSTCAGGPGPECVPLARLGRSIPEESASASHG
jgi:DNA-binding transcriptional MerR regulator